MTEWSSFSAPYRSFLAQSPQVTIRIGLAFCVWNISSVGYPHAKNFPPNRHKSGDMTDETDKIWKKCSFRHFSFFEVSTLTSSAARQRNNFYQMKEFFSMTKILVQNDGKNDGYDEKMTFMTKKMTVMTSFSKKMKLPRKLCSSK